MDVGIKMANMGEILRVFLINTSEDEVTERDMPNALSEMKRLVGSKTIDISDLVVGNKIFKVVHSLNTDPSTHISVLDEEGRTVFRGNVIIIAYSKVEGGELLRDLMDDELAVLKNNTGLMRVSTKNNEVYNAYALCNARKVERK